VHLGLREYHRGFTEAAVEEVSRAAADEQRRRSLEAAVKEMLLPTQAKEFLMAVENIVAMVRRHGTRARRGPGRWIRLMYSSLLPSSKLNCLSFSIPFYI
jgi:hypothetical protein